MLEEIRKIVRDKAEEEDWKYHIVPVVKYAKQLAVMFKEDEETAELAALLHDIGRLMHGGENENHEIIGVPEAEKILKEHGYPKAIIDEVKHCVESHRSGKGTPPRTPIARIIANADAMSHFDALLVFMFWRCKKSDFEEAFRWVDDKIERDWNKKLTIPEAKELMREKYKAIRLVLDSTKGYR
ncbi:MAG: HD domain-containing protein [Nanoarchaeota archaeon]